MTRVLLAGGPAGRGQSVDGVSPRPGEAWPCLLEAQENSPMTLGVSCFQPRNLGTTGQDCIDRCHPTVCTLLWPDRVASGPRGGLNSVGMLVLP